MGPYRTPSRPLDEKSAAPSANESDLGTERSTHRLSGATALLANAVGKTTTLIVCDNGLRIVDEEMDRSSTHAIAFDEIHFLYYDFDEPLTTSPNLTIVTANGSRCRVPQGLEHRELVLDALRRKVTRPLARSARELMMEGERLTFGPVCLVAAGIELDAQGPLAWNDLGEVVAARQALVFYRRQPLGRFGWVRLGLVPNPPILLEILETRTRVTYDGVGF